MEEYVKVLDFWFEELTPEQWFKKDPNLDNLIRDKFEDLYSSITCGGYLQWRNNPFSLLAKIIVLDQFSRNMFRDTQKMFTFDMLALNLAKLGIDRGFDKELSFEERAFMYMPFMHSEDIEDQNKCVELFKELAKEDSKYENNLNFAIRHKEIIEQFNRFPHRNEILERPSTSQEIEFLKKPNSSF